MKNSISLVLSILVLFSAAILSSCTSGINEDEIKSTAASLIEKSIEVNKIYFGTGLPVSEEDSAAAKAFAAELDVDVTALQYLPVESGCQYSTIEQLKSLAGQVYSKGYCDYLNVMAFEGLAADEDTVCYARYIEDETGVLTVKVGLDTEGVQAVRTYDLNNIEIVKKISRDKVKIKAQSYVDGAEDLVVTLTLVLEDGQWRLDTPTY